MTDHKNRNYAREPSEEITPKQDAAMCDSHVTESTDHVMERAEALAVLHLDEKANAFVIDERFWQLTKRYRKEENDEMLSLITSAYDVASGRYAKKESALEEVAKSRKFLGKTARQWKVYFYYSWWKFLAAALVLVVVTTLVHQIFFTPGYDIKIVSAGHFSLDNTMMQSFLEEDLGYENPYVACADLIADESEEGNMTTVNGESTFSAMISLKPDVLIFDYTTMQYNLPYLEDMDEYYAYLQSVLPPDKLSAVTPITCSMEDYYSLFSEEDLNGYVLTAEDKVDHVYGLEITDPDTISALGYVNNWSEKDPSLVIGISNVSEDKKTAEDFISSLLLDLDYFTKDK